MHERIIYLSNKYSYLRKKEIYVNSITKHFARKTHDSLLSTSCACGTNNPRKNTFYKGIGFVEKWDGITVFQDAFIDKKFLKYKSKFNVALLVESKFVKPDVYKRLYELGNEFDLILTHDKEIIINFEEKARYIPADTITLGATYFGTNFQAKRNLISFNYSNKKYLPGHKLRHIISERYSNFDSKVLHKLGSGPEGIRIDEKGEMLKSYFFSICIENSLYEDYFTEKILDCFISGVIPIYWGTSNIYKYFNERGIFRFESLAELDEIINKIKNNGIEIYKSMEKFVEKNYQTAKSYLYYDDIYLLEIIDYIKSNRSDKDFNQLINCEIINPKTKYPLSKKDLLLRFLKKF